MPCRGCRRRSRCLRLHLLVVLRLTTVFFLVSFSNHRVAVGGWETRSFEIDCVPLRVLVASYAER